MKKISFDVDGTLLNQKHIQQLAKQLVNDDQYDVWIVTTRHENSDTIDVYQLAEEIGINFNNIVFTNGEYKGEILTLNKFDYHIDDCKLEIMTINKKGMTKAYHINDEIKL